MKNITEDEAERIEEKIEFSKEQKLALAALERAFLKCRKLGIDFWDDYGSFTAYNARHMTKPTPDDSGDYAYSSVYTEYEITIGCQVIRNAGDTAGNADDESYFDVKESNANG
jgi:hypothetical protein